MDERAGLDRRTHKITIVGLKRITEAYQQARPPMAVVLP